ncbi:hypothetical protein DL98DRAFT_589688 [Cadophora sp. DSE1049]|nr:hypothetical protein DL98DRAFT_589688 [Cadophora sp. DSE1049]
MESQANTVSWPTAVYQMPIILERLKNGEKVPFKEQMSASWQELHLTLKFLLKTPRTEQQALVRAGRCPIGVFRSYKLPEGMTLAEQVDWMRDNDKGAWEVTKLLKRLYELKLQFDELKLLTMQEETLVEVTLEKAWSPKLLRTWGMTWDEVDELTGEEQVEWLQDRKKGPWAEEVNRPARLVWPNKPTRITMTTESEQIQNFEARNTNEQKRAEEVGLGEDVA